MDSGVVDHGLLDIASRLKGAVDLDAVLVCLTDAVAISQRQRDHDRAAGGALKKASPKRGSRSQQLVCPVCGFALPVCGFA